MQARFARTLPGRNAGFSLIELMVAVTIGLTLLAGLINIVINTSRTNREISQSSRSIENGRFAMKTLEDDGLLRPSRLQ